MSLQNLLKIRRLIAHTPNADETQRLLKAARRNLEDAGATNISPENRFDAAYKAIMQSALVAMWANGYRPATSEPGHHATLIQTLPLTLGLPNERWLVLDALRKNRNLSDYMGVDIDAALVTECIAEAKTLLRDLNDWLNKHKPELLATK